MRSPIRVRCEGSGCPPIFETGGMANPLGMCKMCGEIVLLVAHRMPEHDRDDVIAMIDRGDFDEEVL